jgi:hypothetical protein
MAIPIVIQITPVTLTELAIIVESTNGIEVKTLADCSITASAITLTLPRPPYSRVNLKFYAQGYSVATLENVSSRGSIELIPTSDYIKTSDGTNDYYVKDNYSRQFGNDLLDIIMTKANSSDIPDVSNFVTNTSLATTLEGYAETSDIPTAISDLTDDTSTNPIDKAESVADQRDSSSLKYWTGTKAQYDAIVTKDNNTIYNVEDSSTLVVDILNSLYPIGAIYIGTMATCPLSVLGIGTWQLVAQDRVLQGAGTRGAVGTTINESLPNIKGKFVAYRWTGSSSYSGAIYQSDIVTNMTMNAGNTVGQATQNLDASLSSSTYQDNAPVQQDGYLVNIWERTA